MNRTRFDVAIDLFLIIAGFWGLLYSLGMAFDLIGTPSYERLCVTAYGAFGMGALVASRMR